MAKRYSNIINPMLKATGKMFSSDVKIKLGISYTGEPDETQFYVEWEDDGIYQTSLENTVEQALVQMNNILDLPLEKREKYKV
jgi:hypothetical protein